MTDKVQKIRKEVARLQNELIQGREKGYGSDTDDACILELQNVLTYIDSLQEEPSIFEWSEEEKKSFERRMNHIIDILDWAEDKGRISYSTYLDYTLILKSIIGWQKKGTLPIKGEEPVSDIDFEQELYKAFGQVKDFTLGMRIAKWFYDMGKNHQKPVSEELEAEIKSWLDEGLPNEEELVEHIKETARRFAQWQRQKDEHLIWQLSSTNYEKGIEEGKKQMMKDAYEREVKVDAGGYPYIPHIELYDYDKDVPLAKEGDKYKVILIKEG